MNFSQMILGIVIVFQFYGCGSNSFKYIKINNFNDRIEIEGVSVLPPQESGWNYYKEHKGKLIFGKKGERLHETYAGMVVLSKLPDFNTKEEFLHIFSKQRKRKISNQRFENLLNEEKLVPNSKIMKIMFHTKYKDFEAKNLPSSMEYLIVEDFGATFRHPHNKNIAVTLALSKRTIDEDSDANFKKLADEFLSSVTFKEISLLSEFDKGLEAYDKKAYKTAIKYWSPLSKLGHAVAQNNLGNMYAKGEGVTKNIKEAINYYMLSAKQGYHIGQLNLGASYEYGEDAIKDYSKAFKWYELSAKQGNSQAQLYLGLLYIRGMGMKLNEYKAYIWWRKSSLQGNTLAKKNLDNKPPGV